MSTPATRQERECNCCAHIIRCVHFSDRVLTLGNHAWIPGVFIVNLGDASLPYRCAEGSGLVYPWVNGRFVIETPDPVAATSAFTAAERELLAVQSV